MSNATERALACFTADAVYLEPPDVQLFRGQEELRSYFGALTSGTTMVLQNTWFDEPSQIGAVEFSFGSTSRETATHGVAVVEIRERLIARWREYHRPGPARFDVFLALEDKEWQWSIDNYP